MSTAEPTPEEQAAIDADDIAQAVKDLDCADRILLKLAPPAMSELRGMLGPDEDPRTRHAAGCALIAITERLARVFRRDLHVDFG